MKERFFTITNIAVLLIVIVVICLVFVLGFALVTGVIYLLGWLLRWVLPLSLFESLVLASILATITTIVIQAIVRFFSDSDTPLSSVSPFKSDSGASDLDDSAVTKIPTTRFYKSTGERTWENWFNYEIANDIYADFQIDPDPVKNMNESQRQELAIRLASLGVSILKRKNSGSRNFEVNVNALRRELERLGQKAYDTDLLTVAVDAINANVDYYADELSTVIRDRVWNQRATDLDE